MTSQSLVENDICLPARASTEMLIGELMRRFGHVLLDENVIEHIAPIGAPITERGVRADAGTGSKERTEPLLTIPS
jgi:hypothetical protein